MTWKFLPLAAVCALGVPCAAQAPAAAEPPGAALPASGPSLGLISIQDVARIEGQGVSKLRGIGIVTGLNGTGDDGKDMVLARPLAKVYEANGNPLPRLEELAKAKSAAIVVIEATIPASGARADDQFDVQVTVSHSCKSLAGGRLIMSPLMGPRPGDPVYAIASGPITLDDAQMPTTGKIRAGAQMIAGVSMLETMGSVARGSFTLVLKPHYRSFHTATMLAEQINSLGPDSDLGDGSAGEPIAHALDDVSIRVDIPASERGGSGPARFIGKVMSSTFSPSLLRLPAQVVCNERAGIIVVTGNVEVSPVAISHKDLVITTVTPPPVPTAVNPLVNNTKWTTMSTTGRNSERTRVQDLLAALKQLDVPVAEQIKILAEIERSGRLHGQLVIE